MASWVRWWVGGCRGGGTWTTHLLRQSGMASWGPIVRAHRVALLIGGVIMEAWFTIRHLGAGVHLYRDTRPLSLGRANRPDSRDQAGRAHSIRFAKNAVNTVCRDGRNDLTRG